MSFELVYTSARQGLRPGASGFCTVAATKGIPRNLQSKLESMSGYQQTEAAAAHTPPVNFTHSTIRIQRTIYHVVSRIGHAGKDYTGRSNKIAHHLALTSSEARQLADSPADLLADKTFWFSDWDNEPKHLKDQRQPQAKTVGRTSFETWESVFGDAGWAGLLAQGIANGWKASSVIVPDTEIAKELLRECFLLVKPDKRWKVCFSTHYSRQVSGNECHWRFVMDETSEARKIRARSQGTFIDYRNLNSALLPSGNDYVEAARTADPESIYDKASPEERRRISIRQAQVDDGDEERELRPSQKRRRERAMKQKMTDVQTRSPFDIPEEEYAHIRVNDDETPVERPRRKRKRRQKMSPAVIIVLCLAVALVALLAFFGISQL